MRKILLLLFAFIIAANILMDPKVIIGIIVGIYIASKHDMSNHVVEFEIGVKSIVDDLRKTYKLDEYISG